MTKKHGAIDFSQISDFIFIGTNHCCQTHFDKDLLKLGITAAISLEAENIDHPDGITYFLWLPTKDHTASSKEQFELGIRTLDYCVMHNIKVYVHCLKGHGRAPALVIAYFISQGMPLAAALERVKERRPKIHLEKSQLEALESLSIHYQQ